MKLKLLTIALITLFSIILWAFVTFSGTHSANISVPVNVVNIPENYMLNSLSNESINLSLKGEGWQLAQISFGIKPELTISAMEETKGGTVSVRAALDQSSWLGSGLQIISVNPEYIEYSIEKIKSKVVKIENNLLIDLKPGYGIVSSIKILPDTVRIFGAKSRIDTISVVKTEAAPLKDIDNFVSEEVNLEQIPNVRLNSDLCRVEFDVQKIVDKTFENVPVETRKVPNNKELSLYPPEVKVIIRGGIKNLGKFSREDFKLYVNFNDALSDTMGYIVPQIELPEYFNLTDIRPNRIDYIIKQY
jgi:YbbR domain-containing protein